MLAFKEEVRVTRMIEAGIVPVAWVVAVFALIAAATIVRVIFGVTTEAGRWGTLIG